MFPFHIATIHHTSSHLKDIHLVHLKDITTTLLKPLNLLAGVNLATSFLRLSSNGLLEDSSDIRHGPGRTAEVEGALLLDVGLDDVRHGLAHAVLDVDLLGLVTRKGGAEQGDDAGVEVRLPLLAVQVLLALVAGAEVQKDGADLLALRLLHGAVLDEGAEGRETGTETGHDQGGGVLDGQLHDRGLDGRGDGGAGGKAGEVAGGVAVTGAALGVDPVDDDDHEGDRVGGDGLGGGDGVLAALERVDDADEVVEVGVGRLEHVENVDISDGILLSKTLELVGTLLAAETLELLLLLLVGGELSEGLEEALGRLAEDVDVLDEGLVDGPGLENGGILAGRNLDKVVRVEAISLDELEDLLGVVVGVDTKSLANVVGETGVTEIELNVEDVAIVVGGGETAVFLDLDGVGLDGEVRAELVLGAVGFLESEALGSRLPVLEAGGLLFLLLLEGDEAVGLDAVNKGSNSTLNLSPLGGDLNLADGLVEGVDGLGQSKLVSGEGVELGDVGTSNAEEGNIDDEASLLLESRGRGSVENEELDILLLNLLLGSSRDALLKLVLLEVGKTDDKLAASLDTLDDGNLLEEILLTNEDNVSVLHGVGSLDGLLRNTDVGANNTTLDKVVVCLVNIDVAGLLGLEELANGRRGSNSRGVVDIPEDVLLGLLDSGQTESDRLTFVLAGELVEDRGDGAGGMGIGNRIADIDDLRGLRQLLGEGDSSEDIGVEGRLHVGILDGGSIGDLAENSNLANRGGENLEESLLDERAVNTDDNGADLLALGSQSGSNLLGELGLGAAKDDKNGLGGLMAMVLERSIGGTELVVEGLEKLNDLAGSIQPLVQGSSLLGDLGVDIGNVSLTESIDNPQGLPGGADTVVDVESREDRGQESGEEGHVLDLIGGRAGNEGKTKILSDLESGGVVGTEAILGVVVGSSNVGDEGAGNAIEKGELIERRAKVTKAQRRGQKSLGNMALGQVKVLGEDVAKGKSTGTGPGLKRDNGGGLAVNVLLVGLSPFLHGDIEVESLGGVGEDLVGELVGSLLDKQLAGDIGRPGDGGKRRHLDVYDGGGYR